MYAEKQIMCQGLLLELEFQIFQQGRINCNFIHINKENGEDDDPYKFVCTRTVMFPYTQHFCSCLLYCKHLCLSTEVTV